MSDFIPRLCPQKIYTMRQDNIKNLFDTTYGGYVILSRNVLEHLLGCISVHDINSLYCYLLLKAHFGEPEVISENCIIRRGEVRFDIQELADLTGWKKSKIYDELKLLEKAELLLRINGPARQGHYLLTLYEEHCGHSARKEEHPHSTTVRENLTEKTFEEFFGYYLFITKTKEVDKEKARREWSKLCLADRKEALQNVTRYRDAVTKSEHLKLACNYLKDKSFKF